MGLLVTSERRAIRIFCSSPGDVQAERDHFTEVVNEINETVASVAPEKGISLELITESEHEDIASGPRMIKVRPLPAWLCGLTD